MYRYRFPFLTRRVFSGSQALRYPFSKQRYSTYRTFKNVNQNPNWFDPKTQRRLLWAVAGVGVFYFVNLKEAPITHCKRFLWLTTWMENRVGRMTYNSIMNEYQGQFLPSSHPLQKQVESVVARLIKSSEQLIAANDNNIGDGTFSRDSSNKLQWQVYIINNPSLPPNAFVIPGGKIFIFSSLFPIAKNDDGLAMILSHEISHQLARHIGEQLSRKPLSIIAQIAAYAVLGSSRIVDSISMLFDLRHSRVQESEADYIGFMVMANACFHPEEGYKLWQRFSKYGNKLGNPPEYLSTHPSDQTRIHNMQKWLPEANVRRAEAGCDDVTAFFKGPWNGW